MAVPNGIQFENLIRKFLHDVGFSDVPQWGSHREEFVLGGQEIDAFARINDLYLVIDARTKAQLRRRGQGIQAQLQRINGYKKDVIEDIETRFGSTYGYSNCLFIFWTKGFKILDNHRILAENNAIALRDFFDVKYYNDALKILENQEIVRNSFLKDISLFIGEDVFSESVNIEVQTIRTRIANKKFYTFQIPARHLLKFSYVYRVETNNLTASYQRLLNVKKMKKIRTYLSERGFFANNILVATDEELEILDEDRTQDIFSGMLSLPDKPCYLEIIDGQHRLLAYSNLPELHNHCLCVTAISGLDRIDRAKLFMVVNREQTDVPSSLLWDLYKLIDPDSGEGKISIYVQDTLNERGPFKDIIKLHRVRSPSAYISFTNICSALHNRTKIYEKYGNRRSFKNMLRSYFEVIQSDDFIHEDWERSVSNLGRKGFICTNTGISISLYLLLKILNEREQAEIPFPSSRNMQNWKAYLRDNMILPFRNYLRNNMNPAKPDDPYGLLRRQSNESERREAANTIYSDF